MIQRRGLRRQALRTIARSSGRRLRAAVCGISLIGAVVFGLVGCDDSPPPDSSSDSSPTRSPAPAAFDAVLEDVTAESGVDFVHTNAMQGEKLLPETMGSGVAFLDYDGDGALDLFFVDSRSWNSDALPTTSRLYRGDGTGHFVDVTAETGAGVHRFGMGCAAADADGDGDTDLYITALDGAVYLRNDDGRFVDATEDAGLSSRTWTTSDGEAIPEWSTAAAWFDADRDGDLDLFVGHYCRWTPALEIFTTLDGTTKAFTTPDRYDGLPCRLFFNDGHGRFEEGAAADDLAPHLGKSLGVAISDFDRDGRPDVVVANDTRPNFVFMNLGGGRFEERGFDYGIAYDQDGRARAGMGIDTAEPNAEGHAWVAIGNFSGEPISLYRLTGEHGFEESAAELGLVLPSLRTLAFGVAFADLDLDGYQELLVVNGHIEPDIARYSSDQRYAQRAQLYRGTAHGFAEVTGPPVAAWAKPQVGRGLAYGDWDNDGDLDLVVTANGGSARLLANRVRELERPPRSLRVRLRGSTSNPHALGARVELEWQGRRQVRWVRTGSSYLSQSESTLTFGLGHATGTGTLRVRWPDGTTLTRSVADTDEVLLIDRPQ